MEKINWSRIILGGLLAGLIMNVGEFVLNVVLFAKELEEATRKLNLPPPGGDFIAKAVVLVFITGIVAVLVYAAIRPRFGAGPKTAVIAGVIVWLLAYVYQGLLSAAMGMFPLSLTLIGLAWGLVEVTLATLAGAWLYKESGPESAASHAYQERSA
ncbi:MAG TPA: hypothetical protein VFD58_32340 [Blastocatellia bacterium]|nr:hypothetical protein [Blastocatellia bacterium]